MGAEAQDHSKLDACVAQVAFSAAVWGYDGKGGDGEYLIESVEEVKEMSNR